jgi:hypothetical protein
MDNNWNYFADFEIIPAITSEQAKEKVLIINRWLLQKQHYKIKHVKVVVQTCSHWCISLLINQTIYLLLTLNQ